MKKITVVFMLAVMLVCALNFPIYMLYKYGYYEDNTLNADIKENLEYCKTEKLKFQHEFQKDDIIALAKKISDVDFTLISRKEARDILMNNDIDEDATYVSLPTIYSERDTARLCSIQLFEHNAKNYILCNYMKKYRGSYALYTFDKSDELTNVLSQVNFGGNGRFQLHIMATKTSALSSTLRKFLPIIVVMLILFLPTFTEGKKSTDDARRLAKKMAKIGFVAIPLFLIIAYLRIYI